MAYTRTWDEATPAGTRAANQIDDAIREFRVDLRERMNTTFAVDWSTDPVVAREEVGGPGTRKWLIHGTLFQIESDEGGDYGDDGVTCIASMSPIRANVHLAPNITITRIRWLMSNTSAVLTTCTFESMNFGAGHANTVLDTRTTSSAGADQILDSGVIALAIDDTHCYFFQADQAGGGASIFTIHGVEITFTIPSAKGLR